MSMEEYEIECLRKEAEMEDEESRKESQVANEHWIDAMDEAMRRFEHVHDLADVMVNRKLFIRTVDHILRGIRNDAAMLLPKDHEKYMDQQGDQPNKNKGE